MKNEVLVLAYAGCSTCTKALAWLSARGTKVTVRYQKGKGVIEIKFFNDADLERILNVAGVPADSL